MPFVYNAFVLYLLLRRCGSCLTSMRDCRTHINRHLKLWSHTQYVHQDMSHTACITTCHCILEHILEQGLLLCTSNSALHAVDRNLCGFDDVVSSQHCRWRPEHYSLGKCYLRMSTIELSVGIDRLKKSHSNMKLDKIALPHNSASELSTVSNI